jgi:hypothetical protein
MTNKSSPGGPGKLTNELKAFLARLGEMADPGDRWCRVLEGLRSDHAAPPGVRLFGLGRYRLSHPEGPGLLACERQTEGLTSRTTKPLRRSITARAADVRAKLAPTEVWCQDEMRVGQKNRVTYR